MIPPAFGWGAFVPEGFLTSCSFDYITRTSSTRSYFFYIFVLGFFLPVSIITVCYAFIIRTIFLNEKDMKKNNVKKVHNKLKKRNDYKAAEMIMFVIGMFLVSWIPYSVIATIGQFGNRAMLTPWLCVLPSLFAKMSTIYNPAIYGLSHRHFRATLRRIFKRDQRSSERGGTYFSKNSTYTKTKNGCTCMPNYVASDIFDESSSGSFTGKQIYLNVTVANTVDNNRIIYVKKPLPVQKSCMCDSRCGSVKRSRRDVRFNADNSTAQSASVIRARPSVISMKYDDGKMSLLRSMMFKSESSIYQKYQIYLEKDHIVKIPSAICPITNVTQQKNETSIFPPTEPNYQKQAQYVQVTNFDHIPMQNVIKNVLRSTGARIDNTPCEKMFKECFCRECVYNGKFS